MKSNKNRLFIIFIGMIFLIIILAVWNLLSGSADISAREVLQIVSGKMPEGTQKSIVLFIRMPRLVAAVILGGALAVSGFMLQTFFSNPIAGPYVLGISSGAKMAVAIFMIFMLKAGRGANSAGMIAAAFLGSCVSTGFVLLISQKTNNMSLIIVCGILIGYICSAVTDLLVTFADDANIVNLHNWSMGSLSGMDWNDVKIMTAIILIAVAIGFVMSKPIGAYQLGEEYAMSVGVNVRILRVTIIILSSVLSATVTAFAGPISFIGIAVPHLTKTITKTARPIVHIPACFLGGGLVTLLCDGIARKLFAPTELAIGTVTAVLLVPVVIFMMLKNQKERA